MRDARHSLHPSLEAYVEERFFRWAGWKPTSSEVEFFPYAGFRNVIRMRDKRLLVRLSDLLAPAPEAVQRAVIDELVARLLRREIPKAAQQVSRQFLRRPETVEAIGRVRRQRCRKRQLPPQGDTFDLAKLFDRLNSDFFSGRLRVASLGWSHKPSRCRLGHYDPDLDLILLNRALDCPAVPEYVVRYVLFHEMVHAHLRQAEQSCSRQRAHGPSFQALERRFSEYRRARTFLKHHFRRR